MGAAVPTASVGSVYFIMASGVVALGTGCMPRKGGEFPPQGTGGGGGFLPWGDRVRGNPTTDGKGDGDSYHGADMGRAI